jgi:hypothetical protein
MVSSRATSPVVLTWRKKKSSQYSSSKKGSTMKIGTIGTREKDGLDYRYLGGDTLDSNSYELVSPKVPVVQPVLFSYAAPTENKPLPVMANPLTGFISGTVDWAKGLGKSGEEVISAHQQPIDYGVGTAHTLGKDAALVGNVLATPLTLPAAMVARTFPRATEAIKKGAGAIASGIANTEIAPINTPMWQPHQKSTTVAEFATEHPRVAKLAGAGLNVASITPMGKLTGGKFFSGTNPTSAVASVPYKIASAAAIKAKRPGLASVLENPAKALGTQALRPKIAEYLTKADEVAQKNIPGAMISDKSNHIAKILTEEDLYGHIGNPEKLAVEARKKADRYADEAWKTAFKSNEIVPSPTAAGVANVEKWIEGSNVPGGNTKLVRNALKIVSEDMEARGYNKPMTAEHALEFKKALHVDWKAGPGIKDYETAKNQVRKLMYYGADNLVTNPATREALSKSSNLYKIADVVSGQVKEPWTIKTAGKAALTLPLLSTVPDVAKSLGPVLPIAGGVVGGLSTLYQGIKSGQAGRGMLNLAELGQPLKAPEKILGRSYNPPPAGVPRELKEKVRALSLKAEGVVPLSENKGRMYITPNRDKGSMVRTGTSFSGVPTENLVPDIFKSPLERRVGVK